MLKSIKLTKISIFFVLYLLVSLNIYADQDVVRRAFFDIGSGATRIIIADVNQKTGEIAVVHEQSEKVSYKMDLEVNKASGFSQDIQDKGIVVLAKMKWVALEKGATEFAGVATSAFRSAENGKQFAEFITKVLGIHVEVISQEQEAILGFVATVNKEEKKPQDIVVWDIGGGSMQITMLGEKGNYIIYSGKLASVSFQKYIIEKIQGKDIQKVNTPNPISKSEIDEAIKYAKLNAQEVPESIHSKLRDPDTLVLGIGGVHYYSIRNQVNTGKDYSLDELKKTLESRTGKTDQEIGGAYAQTEISNLALVLGFMEALDIKTVKTKNINMTNGILLSPSFWK